MAQTSSTPLPDTNFSYRTGTLYPLVLRIFQSSATLYFWSVQPHSAGTVLRLASGRCRRTAPPPPGWGSPGTGDEVSQVTYITWRMDGSRGRGRVMRVGLGRHSGREFQTSERASSLHSSVARGVETVGRGVCRASRAYVVSAKAAMLRNIESRISSTAHAQEL